MQSTYASNSVWQPTAVGTNISRPNASSCAHAPGTQLERLFKFVRSVVAVEHTCTMPTVTPGWRLSDCSNTARAVNYTCPECSVRWMLPLWHRNC